MGSRIGLGGGGGIGAGRYIALRRASITTPVIFLSGWSSSSSWSPIRGNILSGFWPSRIKFRLGATGWPIVEVSNREFASCVVAVEFYDEVTTIQAATSNKSVLGATIGGEPGGRAAVIVDDAVDVAHAAKGETSTMIPLGDAEPGRDVFAQRMAKELTSSQSRPEVVSPAEGERVPSAARWVNIGTRDDATERTQQKEGTVGSGGAAEALANEVAHELYPEDDDGA
ncbi:hypothetical protein EDD15DRAFT_2528681 [Pisolithus albus]|nr:hypothetical protein EDD15DRAFT_2528681 [Pisolithus albus]